MQMWTLSGKKSILCSEVRRSSLSPRKRTYHGFLKSWLLGQVYLEHAGTTLYAKSLIERFSHDMTSSLLGNPHSASSSSQLSTRRIEDIRLRVLLFFNADPEEFDVVFVANATAGIKLVMEAFREHEAGYWYGYHRDSHTSLVGVRENATAGQRCFQSDAEVDRWLSGIGPALDRSTEGKLGLFAYPAQSNMNGRRLPLDWLGRIRSSKLAEHRHVYSLLDAAALVSTSPLDLGDADNSPDFTVLSFYKIFGFPDLGALIVRKKAGPILRGRKYFGGGTVEMVTCLEEQWHIRKEASLHEHLEDGTLPFHNIVALDGALDVHRRLYGSMANIALHVMALTRELLKALLSLRHGNGSVVCQIYQDSVSYFEKEERQGQGPVVAFNLRTSHGAWVSLAEVEKLANIRNVHLRTGGLCNPGGVAPALDLTAQDMKRNFSAGQRCGNENDILDGRPSGMIRVSLGAMSNLHDVDSFAAFIEEFFVESDSTRTKTNPRQSQDGEMFVESLTIYPIKSCGGWKIPRGKPWAVGKKGLTWDREWCLVHQGTGSALNQKRYPQMALLRPEVYLEQGLLRVHLYDSVSQARIDELHVPLWGDHGSIQGCAEHVAAFKSQSSQVCGDIFKAQIYTCPEISDFFTRAVGVPCHLAKMPALEKEASQRHSNVHLQKHQRTERMMKIPGAFPRTSEIEPSLGTAIFLSNESPILTISRASLDHLNEQISATGGKPVHAEVFRANIVIADKSASMPAYVEDRWRNLQIGQEYFQIMGSCRRCQMVCIDQITAEKNEEPFVTLAKTRRFDGKVFFGQHTRHLSYREYLSTIAGSSTIRVGDPVHAFAEDDEAFDVPLRACSLVQTFRA